MQRLIIGKDEVEENHLPMQPTLVAASSVPNAVLRRSAERSQRSGKLKSGQKNG
jgi:hypothetical protein